MPKSPTEQEKPSVIASEAKQSPLENPDGRRKCIEIVAAGVSAAAVLAMAKEAKAAMPFDDAVNDTGSDPLERGTTGAQLINGPASDRFDMTFAGMNAASTAQSLYRSEFRAAIGDDGGVIFRRLGAHAALPSAIDTEGQTLIEYIRPDGRKDVIQRTGIDEATGFTNAVFDMNGSDVWPYDGDCLTGSFSFIHPSARTPRTLKVAVNFGEAFDTVDEDIYRVPIDAPVDEATGVNFCTDIRDRILAANALGPGHNACTEGVLQCNAESSWVGAISAPRRHPNSKL